MVTAMEALSHHTWNPTVRGTAAAIALESARAVYADAFISEVPLLDFMSSAGRDTSAGQESHSPSSRCSMPAVMLHYSLCEVTIFAVLQR